MLLYCLLCIMPLAICRTVLDDPQSLINRYISSKQTKLVFGIFFGDHREEFTMEQNCQGLDTLPDDECGPCTLTITPLLDLQSGEPSKMSMIQFTENTRIVIDANVRKQISSIQINIASKKRNHGPGMYHRIIFIKNGKDMHSFEVIDKSFAFIWEDYFHELSFWQNACELRKQLGDNPSKDLKQRAEIDIPEVMRRLSSMHKDVNKRYVHVKGRDIMEDFDHSTSIKDRFVDVSIAIYNPSEQRKVEDDMHRRRLKFSEDSVEIISKYMDQYKNQDDARTTSEIHSSDAVAATESTDQDPSQIVNDCDDFLFEFDGKSITMNDDFVVTWETDTVGNQYRYFKITNLWDDTEYGYFRIDTYFEEYWKIYFNYLLESKTKCEYEHYGINHWIQDVQPLDTRLVDDIKREVDGGWSLSYDHDDSKISWITHECDCDPHRPHGYLSTCFMIIGFHKRHKRMRYEFIQNGKIPEITHSTLSNVMGKDGYRFFFLPSQRGHLYHFRISTKYEFLWKRYFTQLSQQQNKCKMKSMLEQQPNIFSEMQAPPNEIQMLYHAKLLQYGYQNTDFRTNTQKLLYIANVAMVMGDLGMFADRGSGAWDDLIEQLAYWKENGISLTHTKHSHSRIENHRRLDLFNRLAGVGQAGTITLSITSAVVWASCLVVGPWHCIFLAAGHTKGMTLWEMLKHGWFTHDHVGGVIQTAQLAQASQVIWNAEAWTVGFTYIFKALDFIDNNQPRDVELIAYVLDNIQGNKEELKKCTNSITSRRQQCIHEALGIADPEKATR